MSQPQPEVSPGSVYVAYWQQLWNLPVLGEDREYLESLQYRLRRLQPDDVCRAMRHVAERFKARGHGRPPARYLAGIISLREESAQMQGSKPGRRGSSLQRI